MVYERILNGRSYMYKSVRVNGKVKSVYIAPRDRYLAQQRARTRLKRKQVTEKPPEPEPKKEKQEMVCVPAATFNKLVAKMGED